MDHKELIARLRSVESRSKGDLLEEAADIIDQLIADLKQSGRHELCDFCVHGQQAAPCFDNMDWVVDCEKCKADCPCKNCRDNSCFEWRGVQRA